MTSADWEKITATTLKEFTRELTAREQWERNKQENIMNQGHTPNFDIVETRKMARALYRARKERDDYLKQLERAGASIEYIEWAEE